MYTLVLVKWFNMHKILISTTSWQDEKKLREALLFANACGAITVTERGAIPAMPTKEDVLRCLAQIADKK